MIAADHYPIALTLFALPLSAVFGARRDIMLSVHRCFPITPPPRS